MTAALVLFRDRLTYADRCVQSLLRVGLDVHVVDLGSTYLPALAWLSDLPDQVTVWADPYDRWHHPYDPWTSRVLQRHPEGSPAVAATPNEGLLTLVEMMSDGRDYIVTDCDVIPPSRVDWLTRLRVVLDAYPDAIKVGLGMSLDLPYDSPLRDEVRAWEFGLYGERRSYGVYEAPVDTTLALYRAGTTVFATEPALRVTAPYLAVHLPWLEGPRSTPELDHYREHARKDIGHWTHQTTTG